MPATIRDRRCLPLDDTASITLPSPWGPVDLATTRRGVWSVDLRPTSSSGGPGARSAGSAGRLMQRVAALLADAFKGEPVDLADVPLDWRDITAWDRRVLEGARTIGRGQVTSYGRLARRIGAPGAARAVGAAMSRNPFWLLVPCHRVVAGDGSIGGYGDDPDGPEIKRDLLALEGIALPVADLVD